MDDLISRQAAIDALDEQIEQCDKALSSFDISMRDEFAVKAERASLVAFRETLEYLPSAQPKRGKWVDMGKDPATGKWDTRLHIYCSECGHRSDDKPTKYCPNCGVKMEVTE